MRSATCSIWMRPLSSTFPCQSSLSRKIESQEESTEKEAKGRFMLQCTQNYKAASSLCWICEKIALLSRKHRWTAWIAIRKHEKRLDDVNALFALVLSTSFLSSTTSHRTGWMSRYRTWSSRCFHQIQLPCYSLKARDQSARLRPRLPRFSIVILLTALTIF